MLYHTYHALSHVSSVLVMCVAIHLTNSEIHQHYNNSPLCGFSIVFLSFPPAGAAARASSSTQSRLLHFAQVPFIPFVAWNYFWCKSASFSSPGKVSTDHLLLFHLQCKLNLWPATDKEGSLTYSNPAARLLLLHCCCYIVATTLLLLHRCC